MPYQIVKYRPELKDEIAALQTHLWNADVSVNAAHLEWKYEHNPYLTTPLIYVAQDAGKAVAMRGIYGVPWQIGIPPRVLPAVCFADSVTAPEHRKRGLWAQITRTALSDLADMGYEYVLALSASPVTYRAALSTGWRSVGYLEPMRWRARRSVLSDRLRRHIRSLPLRAAKQREPFHDLDKHGAQRRGRSTRVCVEPTPRPEAMAELVARLGGDGRIRPLRDRAYFGWRFRNPRARYRFLFWQDGALEGYLVLRAKLDEDAAGVSIVDWETSSSQVRADLLRTAIDVGNFDSLTTWTATLSEETKTLLRDAGFERLEEPRGAAPYLPAALVRPVRDEMLEADWVVDDRRLLDLANWDLRMIYSDGY